ncbi:MAG: hypothetical protein Q7J45_00685 [bacterium]|nr:hypothetical protein [bacterium]
MAKHPWRNRENDVVMAVKLRTVCPEETEYLWEIWQELSLARNPGKAISFTEIKAWSDLTGIVLNPFEIGLVRQVDVEFLHQASK